MQGNRTGLVVTLNNRLYLADVQSNGTYSFAAFDDVNDATVDGNVDDANGVGFNVIDFAKDNSGNVQTALMDAAVVTNAEDALTAVSSYVVTMDTQSLVNTSSLSPANLTVNLAENNGSWVDTHFSSLTIDIGLNFAAVDENGCILTGMATATTTDVFSFDVTYSGCSEDGTYQGILLQQSDGDVDTLTWMAFDADNNGVFGQVDTQVQQDEALEVDNQLKPSLYVSDDALMISIEDDLYFFEYEFGVGTNNPFVFEYTHDEANALISGAGVGLVDEVSIFGGDISFNTTESMLNLDVGIQYTDASSTPVNLNYPNLEYVAQNQMLDTLEGQWGQIVINSSGAITGLVNGCLIDGMVIQEIDKVSQVTMELAGCASAGSYSGVLLGTDTSVFNSPEDGLILHLKTADNLFWLRGLVFRSS